MENIKEKYADLTVEELKEKISEMRKALAEKLTLEMKDNPFFPEFRYTEKQVIEEELSEIRKKELIKAAPQLSYESVVARAIEEGDFGENELIDLIKDKCEIIEMPYDEYKEGYSKYHSIDNSYNPDKSTIKVYVDKARVLKDKQNQEYIFTYDEYWNGYRAQVRDKTKTQYEPLPSTINGKPLVSLEDAFQGCFNLKNVPKIPDSVKDMKNTFAFCFALTEPPVIPDSVTNMERTFVYCKNLKEAPEIPDSVKDMKNTFAFCASLTEVPVIPYGVENMEDTFYHCKSLVEAPEIPNSVTNMEKTFMYCSSLTEAPKIPDSVTNMEKTFAYCENLKEAPEIPDSVRFEDDIFEGCTTLGNIELDFER